MLQMIQQYNDINNSAAEKATQNLTKHLEIPPEVTK